ncbi:FAD assembly factor SdhE [Amorphus orientalis]|uniref:FAD assembly factor SdhE n=1 Tax=Amorphus orientalis TaxID=649198 RepID=A0AAE3VP28_9HYPH|nr:succinate dehydrogenase assembly factor 2 [Amorphus orientalis]MDQ0315664.1 antitoxin CptB [Amorphus orientalis]
MSGTTRSSADLDPRRRRLLFHAWHRGTREMDLLLGRFADETISDLTDDELEAFEALMGVPDPELYGWLAGSAPIPPNWDGPLLRRIISFHTPT